MALCFIPHGQFWPPGRALLAAVYLEQPWKFMMLSNTSALLELWENGGLVHVHDVCVPRSH